MGTFCSRNGLCSFGPPSDDIKLQVSEVRKSNAKLPARAFADLQPYPQNMSLICGACASLLLCEFFFAHVQHAQTDAKNAQARTNRCADIQEGHYLAYCARTHRHTTHERKHERTFVWSKIFLTNILSMIL